MCTARGWLVCLSAALAAHAQLGPSQRTDWMLHGSSAATRLSVLPDRLVLSNGLIERSFFTGRGALCTIEYRQTVSQQSFFRSPSPEANLTLSGRRFNVGGCIGVPAQHHEFWNPIWTRNLTNDPDAFQLANYTTGPAQKPFEWSAGRRYAPTDIAWPPRGLRLTLNFVPPAGASGLERVLVQVHYEMYDQLPGCPQPGACRARAGCASG